MIDMPGNNSISLECIFRVFCHGIIPELRHGIKRLHTVMIQINEMPRRFLRIGIPPSIRINGMFGNKCNMVFVEAEQRRWHGKTSHPVNLFMRPKAPAEGEESNNE